jgi:predicted short-subunit dehydrogenase-like oxidoreductase (DUF2520 family)
MSTPSIESLRVGIVGAGRVGTALATSLRSRGLHVVGPLGRGADGTGCDVVLLCVPDAELERAVRPLREGVLVGHTSGATTLAPLAPHEAFSLHPLLSVSRENTTFAGAGCAIAGSTSRALATARALARVLQMTPFVVTEADRPLYHAAASMASNYLVALEGAAESLFAATGVSREHVAPLVRSAMEQWAQVGAQDALTGPLARGDEETVSRQRAAIERRASSVLPLWDALTDATRALAESRRGPAA